MTEPQVRAPESYIQAMRTGEGSAARQAARYLAEDIVLITATEQIDGREEVLRRITGQWPMTPVYYRAAWPSPVVACTNPDGSPNLTLRSATQVFSDTQLSVWLRHAEGDTVNAIRTNPKMAALYRDSRTRATLIFHGTGHRSALERR
jgi:hypothetical protein